MTEISQVHQNPAPAAPGLRPSEQADSARARLQGQENETQQLDRQARAAQQGKAVSRSKESRGAENQRRSKEIREELQSATEKLNSSLPPERGIRFQVSGEGEDLVVQVVNLQDDEVIRSIPPERLNDFRENFRELTGLLLDDKA